MAERFIGFKEHMPFEEYDAVDALNGSSLIHIRRSPMAYRYQMDNPQVPTDAMKLGTTIHTAILEPPLLGKIAVWGTKPDEKVRRGSVWEAFQKANEGLILLTRAEQAEVADSVEGVYDCATARQYLVEEGKNEISMFWVDESGRYWKGRLDKVIRTAHTATIVDLKKTRSCSSRRFGSQAYALGYHIKAAIYVSGFQTLTGIRPKFRWIAIESKPPFECAVYRATPDVLSLGGEEQLNLVRLLDECERTQNWPPEQEQEEDLILPDYALSEQDSLEEFSVE
jgi:exodeoxyribonuclease VIII